MKGYFIWLLKLITLLGVFFIVIPLCLVVLAAGIAATSSTEQVTEGKKSVAVVELNAVITNTKDLVNELYRQAANDKVKGIVLRIDSPGGGVGASQDVYTAVTKLKAKKPIVASMGGVAASGGLYAALGASKVFAQPGTITGSIGVIMQLPNFTQITDKVGLQMITIKSGKLKDVGNSFREMTEEEREYLQRTITLAHQDFIQAVADGRKIAREKVVTFADGRIILGSEAKQLGLIDEFGDVHDAARAVFELLGQPLEADEEPNLYYPEDKFEKFRKFLESFSFLPEMISGKRMEMQYILN